MRQVNGTDFIVAQERLGFLSQLSRCLYVKNCTEKEGQLSKITEHQRGTVIPTAALGVRLGPESNLEELPDKKSIRCFMQVMQTICKDGIGTCMYFGNILL